MRVRAHELESERERESTATRKVLCPAVRTLYKKHCTNAVCVSCVCLLTVTVTVCVCGRSDCVCLRDCLCAYECASSVHL